jgi:16S rRNA (cytosine967-C5)-methyltransferase
MRRRMDLRWRIKPEEISRLATLQRKLLAVAGELTRPGGVLVYSTCSLESEENERVVEHFRDSQPGWLLEATRSTFPPRDGMDGAFVVRLRKTNAA